MLGNEQKTIVINGATGGIGSAIAKKLAEQRYSLILVGRDDQKLSHLKEELSTLLSKNSVETFAINELKKEQIEQITQNILSKYSQVYGYINSSGYVKQGGMFEVSDENWLDLFKLTLMSNIWFISGLVKKMIENKDGRIILINGILSTEPSPHFIINSTLTGAVRNFAKALSKYMGQHKVTVNTVNPGATDTGLWQNLVATMSEQLNITAKELNHKSAADIPLNRIATPQDIANCVSYLCSREAEYVNGASLIVDGGVTASC